MADSGPVSPDRVPTLTDVLHGTDGTDGTVASVPTDAPEQETTDDSALAAELLASIQDRIDSLFQARLREAVAPALARAVDGLLRELGPELASAMRETAERAVAQELARRRRKP